MLVKIAYSVFLMLCLVAQGNAAMTISGTRIIFPGSEKEVNVRTNNRGSNPALVQVWVDDGNANGDVNTMKIPFMTTPPVYRVEPGKGQSVRLIYNGMALPQDRESLFWFNLLEVPPVVKGMDNVDRLELAFRTRIKIFYRPKSLSGSGTNEVDKLKWEILSNNKGVRVTNPTPYYLSFDSVSAEIGGKSVVLTPDMIKPFGSSDFLLENKGIISGLTSVKFKLINDYGSTYNGQLNLAGGKELVLQKK
ncbi:fimbria/pilus periplasmic chaperone [Erwinia tracheiphila]|uniref:Pilus assembly protein n=1 Tax=Erwinia tracheiphila TaxID=65700 RepID=A0A0M2KET2_9GAMM|nr:fimbria/pilus periplasmic chaperone [Erwinia tracheiphila]AXF78852.1 pilus assembly protein [Erwinia tracheiphila]KKF37895.1 pilus assembly protein [Erwinia tracheiphila]UIA85847.1 fimbria/pilus periplasmic chaperone [Erwinia tracheiphila]UIA89971.1 fimbria/pilus periplasmic chaperone [Erwinia tracheiphila]UIA94370.1 fimbria/pilus periplasmic chaperone [Erwinia tracheiphila]